MSNKEKRLHAKSVHMFLGIQRTKDGEKSRCICSVIKHDEEEDLKVFKAKLECIGGTWRIYKTVNARCVETARKNLIKKLIDHPEKASLVDTEWRTALLQSNCIYGEKRFMLDIDTEDHEIIDKIDELICDGIKIKDRVEMSIADTQIKTPNGWHFIAYPFDTREVCKIPEVTLLRDGYYFVDIIND